MLRRPRWWWRVAFAVICLGGVGIASWLVYGARPTRQFSVAFGRNDLVFCRGWMAVLLVRSNGGRLSLLDKIAAQQQVVADLRAALTAAPADSPGAAELQASLKTAKYALSTLEDDDAEKRYIEKQTAMLHILALTGRGGGVYPIKRARPLDVLHVYPSYARPQYILIALWAPLAGLTLLGLTPLLLAAWRIWRANRRLRSGRCSQCNYPLTGLPEARCPECGTPFQPNSD